MFDTHLRALKDRLATPLALRLKGVSPDRLTLVALAVGVAAAVCAAQGWNGWALALWLLNRAIDGFDGLIARLHDKQNDFGGYLDILVDFVVYALVPLGLVWSAPTVDHYLALAVLLVSFYINTASWMYLAAILEKRHAREPGTLTTIVMPSGLIGGTETILAYSLFMLFPAKMSLLFYLFAALVMVTVGQRLLWAWRMLR